MSAAHLTLLREAERRGILHSINQGRRTIAEQTRFWLDWLRFRKVLAAFPSRSAPHIKAGHVNHALDVNAPAPVQDLAAFYRALGVPCVFNVPGESWHLDFPDEGALIRAAHLLRDRGGLLVTLCPGMRHQDVRSLRYHLWRVGEKDATAKVNKTFYGLRLKRAVKRFQKRKGLRANGIVGPATWRALKHSKARR